jgi:hypothetical protein
MKTRYRGQQAVARVLSCVAFLVVSFASAEARNFYINSRSGNDKNPGTSKARPWKSVGPLATLKLEAGDSLFFAPGQRFTGPLLLQDISGTAASPVYVGVYGSGSATRKPVLDAGQALYAIHLQNASFVEINGLEITAPTPIFDSALHKKPVMRCGILAEITNPAVYRTILLKNLIVHDVYMMPKGFARTAAEVQTANGTQSYGWGIRFMNNSKGGKMLDLRVERVTIYNVSHTGLKFTAEKDGIDGVTVSKSHIHHTGGPGMQMSGVRNGHIHHNRIDHSGSADDSRNWARGSGFWTWSCSGILIEYNRFEYANGPGDSAGMHIDFNCSDVVVQYNLSANNAGGFCEILGNNFNCAYRYNISINDGYRVKGEKGAFQEGKIFWLSGYVGNGKKNTGPFNSYFYNNTVYVSKNIVPRIAVSSSAQGVLIANNIFYFENGARMVAGDQKKLEAEQGQVPNVVFTHNLYLRADNWPAEFYLKDANPFFGNPVFKKAGGWKLSDYVPADARLVADRGIAVLPIPGDSIGLRIGLPVKTDILGNPVRGLPDLGAIELKAKKQP